MILSCDAEVIDLSSSEKVISYCAKLAIEKISSPVFSVEQINYVNFEELYQEAESSKLLLLVYNKFILPNKSHISSRHFNKFTLSAKKITCRHLQLTSELIKICDILAQNKILFVVLKGPVLNHQLYGSQIMRTSSDLDILVHPKDIQLAHKYLINAGYDCSRSEKEITAFSKRKFLPGAKDASYSTRNIPFRVEVHWKTGISELIMPEKYNDWHKVIKYISFQNKQLPVLVDELNLLYLCLHGAVHYWSRTMWLVDIPLFFSKCQINMGNLLNIAQQKQIHHIVIEAFIYAQNKFNLQSTYISPHNSKSLYLSHRIWIINCFNKFWSLPKKLLNLYNQAIFYKFSTSRLPMFIYYVMLHSKNIVLKSYKKLYKIKS